MSNLRQPNDLLAPTAESFLAHSPAEEHENVREGSMKRLFACAAVATAIGFCASTADAGDGALAWSYRYVLVMSTVDGELAPVVSAIAHDATLRDTSTC